MSDRVFEIVTSSFMKLLIPGITVTIPLTILSFLLSLVLGLLLAVSQTANIKGLKQFSVFYIWIFRGTPLIVQLFIIFHGLPTIGIYIEAFWAAIIAFGLNLAAYNAEAIRAAILAIPEGQLEAAYMIGLSYSIAMIRIVLPQAFQIAFPSLFNNLISLLKDTSLASSITVVEMFAVVQQITGRTYEYFALYLEVAFIYLIFSTLLTFLQSYLEKKFVWKSDATKEEKRGRRRAMLG